MCAHEISRVWKNGASCNWAGLPDRSTFPTAGPAAAFRQSNPIPLKAALAAMGLCEPVWHLPLVPPQPTSQAKIEGVLRQLELLK
jgi:4-hydroxy-tetrahydrodipicolinate synthase